MVLWCGKFVKFGRLVYHDEQTVILKSYMKRCEHNIDKIAGQVYNAPQPDIAILIKR